jgi:hypothetical protein
MAQLVSLVLMAAAGFGLYWLYVRQRALPDPSGISLPSSGSPT